jgi:hypothetical protein
MAPMFPARRENRKFFLLKDTIRAGYSRIMLIEQFRRVVAAQFEAALCMMNDCLAKCPDRHWEGIVGKYPFWQVAYHTLCFVDLYLTKSHEAFEFRAIHPGGWKEFDDEHPSRRFEREELLDYLQVCRAKILETIAAETPATLEGPSGFSWIQFSRAEMHLYNMRHVQHHAGQLSAFLRKAEPSLQDPKVVRWVSTGWK